MRKTKIRLGPECADRLGYAGGTIAEVKLSKEELKKIGTRNAPMAHNIWIDGENVGGDIKLTDAEVV